MSEGYTPGPWSVPHFARPDVNCECGYVLTDHLMGAVCTVHASGDGDDWAKHGDNPKFAEACANAHLIAAAPDMLAALQAVVGAGQYPESYQGGIEPLFVKIVRAAIAKATQP